MKIEDKKFHCEKCKGIRNHAILFEKIIEGDDSDNFSWFYKYLVIECSGCENISFVKIYGDTEMITCINDEGYSNYDYYYDTFIYPPLLENGCEIEDVCSLPYIIQNIYKETINAFKYKSFILTAAGFRTIIEAICMELDIKATDLGKKINQLHTKGHISKTESNRLHAIRFIGNDSLHDLDVPKEDQLIVVLDIINNLLINLFIHDKQIKSKMESMICEYSDFIKLLVSLVSKKQVNDIFDLKSLLGKSKRRFDNETLDKFQNIFIGKIKDGVYNFISFIEDGDIKRFKITSLPLDGLNYKI